ncbi:hypothetical protein [Thermonema rossianum]|jgi:hypothetical protein|uniref:hypothetical protein n=1 Tax=Thermonema rossianum TaxID=55505 RepID=UPI00056F8816|nr:hypothetical protein [Thermonema rossianum]
MCGIHFRVDRFENRCERCGKLLIGEDTYFDEERLCENCLAQQENKQEEAVKVVTSEEEAEEKTKPEE